MNNWMLYSFFAFNFIFDDWIKYNFDLILIKLEICEKVFNTLFKSFFINEGCCGGRGTIPEKVH